MLDSSSISDVQSLLRSLGADERAETINSLDEAIHALEGLRSVVGGKNAPAWVDRDDLGARLKARKSNSKEGRENPWERAPEPLKPELSRDVFQKRLQEWHDFWLSLIPPEVKIPNKFLLLEIAYPQNCNTSA